MTRVLFICHGNICRSPMAEFMFKKYVADRGMADSFTIRSAATSYEEIGNGVYPLAKRKLAEHGICDVSGKRAVHLEKSDYHEYDFLICMDTWNVRNTMRIIDSDPEGKVFRMLDFTKHPRDISDPWYTDDFDATYNDICEGMDGFWAYLTERGLIIR